MGGPSLEPTATLHGDTLIFSSSHPAALALENEGISTDTLPESGNLFVRIFPAPVADAVTEAGALLAENGLLKGYTRATFERQAGTWKANAAKIAEASGLAAHQNGNVSLSLRLVMAAPAQVATK